MNDTRSRIRAAGLLCIALLACAPAHASDTAKEKRWADQIADQIFDGAPVWLTAGDHKFLAIYTGASGPARGTAIVMHGLGIHPDWPLVVNPLRVRLPQRGWATLSIQMPVLPNEAVFNDYLPLMPEVAPRVEAALRYLKDKGAGPVFLVAHSLGATMAGYYLTQGGGGVDGFVAIGMGGHREHPQVDGVFMTGRINLPMLDLYGSDDQPGVRETAAERKLAGSHNKAYSQVRVPGANHFFEGQEAALVQVVGDWLDAQVAKP